MFTLDSVSINTLLDASCLEALFRRFSLDELMLATGVCSQWRTIIAEKVLTDLTNRKSLIFVIRSNSWIKNEDPSWKTPTTNGRTLRKFKYPVPGGPLLREHSNQLVVRLGFLNSSNSRVLSAALEWMASKMPSLDKIELVMHHNHAIQASEFARMCDRLYQPKKIEIDHWAYVPACGVQVEARFYPNEARR